MTSLSKGFMIILNQSMQNPLYKQETFKLMNHLIKWLFTQVSKSIANLSTL